MGSGLLSGVWGGLLTSSGCRQASVDMGSAMQAASVDMGSAILRVFFFFFFFFFVECRYT